MILRSTATVLLALLLLGQTNYSLIKGMVFTADGRPLRGAKILIQRLDVEPKLQKKTRREAYSDRNGEFAFRMDVGPAKFRLTIEAKGFKSGEKEVEVSSDERMDISVVLQNN
jgi:hypothetical protein